jgi:hypothetical protein
MFLGLGLPECPTNRPPTVSTTTHPDQQDGIWIPDGTGGVTLAVGNDGSFYRQHQAAAGEFDNGGWGNGNDTGMNTLLPYGIAAANDGTVWAGLLEKAAFQAPAGGSLQIRFRLSSDQLISSPLYTGAWVDDVAMTQ